MRTCMHHDTHTHVDRQMHVYIASQNMKICVQRRGCSCYVRTETCTVMYAHWSINIFVCVQGWKCCQELEVANTCQFRCTEIRVYANRHREICVSARELAPCNARSFRALSHSSSPAAGTVVPKLVKRAIGFGPAQEWSNRTVAEHGCGKI